MKKSFWLLIFFIVLLADLVGIFLNNEWVQYISKPLIVPVLIVYFLFQTAVITGPLKKLIVGALIFSWLGDVLLMFQAEKALFFLLGLSSFLLAHVLYIIFFHGVRVRENVKSNPWLLVVVVIYYAALLSWLSPFLGEMKIPVRIYGIVISFMLMLALHMAFIKNRVAGKWMVAGALLFVMSDSLLAINKFYQSFGIAEVLIMLTYGFAQLYIIKGAADYINSVANE